LDEESWDGNGAEKGFTPEEFLKISSWLTGADLTSVSADDSKLSADPKELAKRAVVIRALRCVPSSALSAITSGDDSTFQVGFATREALLNYISLLGKVMSILSEQVMYLDELYLSFIGEQLRQVQELILEETRIAAELEQEVVMKLQEEAEALSVDPDVDDA